MGAKGFKAVWTEIKEGPGCKEFLCRASSFCIAKQLKCNGVNNCGQDDKSDENDCKFNKLDCFNSMNIIVVLQKKRVIGHS